MAGWSIKTRCVLSLSVWIASCGAGDRSRDTEAAEEPSGSPPEIATGSATPTANLDESACRFVWPSNEPSGCEQVQWCVPLLTRTACFEEGTGVDGDSCAAYDDCAEGFLCRNLQCTPLCLESEHCLGESACVQQHDASGARLGYGLCRATTPAPCCVTSGQSCSCYEPCPFAELPASCEFDEGSACCYTGVEEDGLPLCVCLTELPEGSTSCAEFVAGQERARGTPLSVVPRCSAG